MPLPLLIGAAAVITGITGVGAGIHGAVKMKDANDTMKSADRIHHRNLDRFKEQNKTTTGDMDKLGSLELEILKSFEEFSEAFEKIQNKPEFEEYKKDGVTIPKYNGAELKKVSVGAGVLLGGLGGAAVGTAGGFAAAGATTAAVMALGTASTGTAIASLSGAAATNATLAALGGGAIAAGGGGVALGTTILGAATLGVGLLVGGVIFNFTGSSLSDKADEAWRQMKKAEKEIDTACTYMKELSSAANDFKKSLTSVNRIYRSHLNRLKAIVNVERKTDWDDFTDSDQLCTENCVLLVGLLFSMCKVQLVKQSNDKDKMNIINHEKIDEAMDNADQFLRDLIKFRVNDNL